MLKIKEYVKVNSLEEAYELNQKKSSRVLGGMVWMKMMNRSVGTAIDLSGLGLDTVKETEDEFVIGCMASLRTLETHAGINTYTDGAVRESLRHMLGWAVQKLCNCGRQHLWQIWVFGCAYYVFGAGFLRGAVWRRQNLHGRVLEEEGGQGYPGEYHC